MPKFPLPSAPKHIHVASPSSRAPRLTRWAILLTVSGAFALTVASLSSTASFDERLIDVAAKGGLSPDVYRLSRQAPAMQALLLDVAGDRDLTAKISLGLEKYGESARDVFESYGTDPMFREQLRRYGEGIVPVIAYFRAHDMATLRARYKAERLAASVKSGLQWRPWGKKAGADADTPPTPYNAEKRGLLAVERIQDDGHNFLGQFNIDSQGVAHWSQTERVLENLEGFLFGGVRDLEQKHDVGDTLNLADYAWAGAEVLAMASAAKAMKLLKSARAASSTAKGTGIVDRVKLLGGRALANDKLGPKFVRIGARVGAAYLVISHPSLLNGIAVEMGRLLGLPAWLSVTLLWWGIAGVLLVFALPLLAGITVLVKPLTVVAKVARWLWPARSARDAPAIG